MLLNASYVGCHWSSLHAVDSVGLSGPHFAVLHPCMDRMRVNGQVAFGFQSMYVPVLRWFVSPACLVVVDVVQPVLVTEGLVLDVSHRVKPCRKGLCQLYWFVMKVLVAVAKLLLATVRITDALPEYSPEGLGRLSKVRPHCQGRHSSPLYI